MNIIETVLFFIGLFILGFGISYLIKMVQRKRIEQKKEITKEIKEEEVINEKEEL